jgi:alpha-ribazole phosphatase/probable phosphoglycerate mutase
VQIAFVRHAEASEDVRGRCYGSLDVGLSARGRLQASRLGDALAAEPVRRVLSSARVRARLTAEALAEPHGLPVELDERLCELDFGILEGAAYDEIAATRPDLYARWMTDPTAVVFPGGEGYEDLRRRATAALDDILSASVPTSLVVVVTHGGVIRALLADVLRLPRQHVFRIAVDPCSVTRVGWLEGEPTVLGVNHVLGEGLGGAVR